MRRSVPGWVVFLLVAVVAAAVGGGIALHQADKASDPVDVPAAPATIPVVTTVPYAWRPGPGGTTVLTEPVDEISLAVPDSWKTPAADPYALPGVLDSFANQAPALATALQSVGQLVLRSGVRLFAYQPAAPHAFVSVISFSAPGAKPFTPSNVAEIVALSKKKTSSIAVTGAQLAVGEVLKLDSSVVVQQQPVVVEFLILVAKGREVEIEMVTETSSAGIPALFGQIAGSLKFAA